MRTWVIWSLLLATLIEPMIAVWVVWSDVQTLATAPPAVGMLPELRRLERTDLPALLAGGLISAALLILLFLEIRRERSLRQSTQHNARAIEEEYRLLFEDNPLPMWVYEVKTLRFLAVNQAAIRHYGYARDEFLAMTIKEIRPAEEIPRLRQSVHNIRQSAGLEISGIWTHRKKNGETVQVEIHSHGLRFQGRQSRLVLAHDVTARLAAEAQVRQLNAELEQRVQDRTAELESANQELEAFSYSVAHDLRGPLRGMDGFSQALIEDYAGKLDATARDYLQRIRAGAQRMGMLIDDLLELARVSRAEMRREPVNLSSLAQTVMEEVRRGGTGTAPRPGGRRKARGPRRSGAVAGRPDECAGQCLEIHRPARAGAH